MKKLFLSLIIFLSITTISFSQFTIVGNQIDGNAPNDNFGFSVAMNDDGKIIAVGAPLYDNDFGQVRVYEKTSSGYTQIGQDINGYEIGQQYGFSVALNASGKRLVLGGLGGNPGSRGGHVRIYNFINNQWVFQDSILAEAVGDQFGGAIAMSASGNRMIVGASKNNGNGNASGHVRVFELKNGSWSQMGADIDGESPGDAFGFAVSMSADGEIIAAGASNNDDAGPQAGHARAYQWIGGSWVQMGTDIDGQNSGDITGFSVSLSDDGQMLAVASPLQDHGAGTGATRVYQFLGIGGAWTQKGMDIIGNSNTEAFGEVVSLSGNGQRIAIGTKSNDDNAMSSGKANMYDWSGGAWTEITPAIKGVAQFDNLGKSVAMNKVGTGVVVGANLAGGTAGYAVVYEDSQRGVGIDKDLFEKFNIVSTPQQLLIQLEPQIRFEPIHIHVFNLAGQKVLAKTFSEKNEIQLNHSLTSGMYVVEVKQGNVGGVRKVIVE